MGGTQGGGQQSDGGGGFARDSRQNQYGTVAWVQTFNNRLYLGYSTTQSGKLITKTLKNKVDSEYTLQ